MNGLNCKKAPLKVLQDEEILDKVWLEDESIGSSLKKIIDMVEDDFVEVKKCKQMIEKFDRKVHDLDFKDAIG